MLCADCKIPIKKFSLAPFLGSTSDRKLSSFDERRDFVFIGGYDQKTNIDAVRKLKQIWPRIRQATIEKSKEDCGDLQLHVHGVYLPDDLHCKLHDPASFFFMHNCTGPVDDILADKRVMLSPFPDRIRAAGVKGKHVEAWRNGVPIVTTMSGGKGMFGEGGEGSRKNWGGRLARNDDEFVGGAQNLYNSKAKFDTAKKIPNKLLKQQLCNRPRSWDEVAKRLVKALTKKVKEAAKNSNESTIT
jgi:glycosyltransferase involved in cell wall biosynthesis